MSLPDARQERRRVTRNRRRRGYQNVSSSPPRVVRLQDGRAVPPSTHATDRAALPGHRPGRAGFASAADYCVGSPAGCTGTNEGTEQAFDDAKANAGADRVLVGPGSYSRADGFRCLDTIAGSCAAWGRRLRRSPRPSRAAPATLGWPLSASPICSRRRQHAAPWRGAELSGAAIV
jgi:hypothetical protein